jgi:Fe-S-cluster-containing hydrogenase component 2
MKVDENNCTNCGACNQACIKAGRGGCITFNPKTGIAQVCDLCGGEPQCAKYCPSNVLHFLVKSMFSKRLAKPEKLIASSIADQFYPVNKQVEELKWLKK